MPVDLTFTEARQRFQSISGLESLTSADLCFLQNSFSRSALNAYHMSNLWPRFLRVNEARSLSSEPVSTVTYTYPESIQIGPSPYVSGVTDAIYRSVFVDSFVLNDIYTLGENINGMPAWYSSIAGSTSYSYVIALGADTVRYGLYTINDNGLSASPTFFFNRDDDNIILPSVHSLNSELYIYDVSADSTFQAYTYHPDGTLQLNYPGLFQFTYNGLSSSQSTVLTGDVVPYSELNKDDIGEFIRISKEKAYDINSVREYEFYVDSNGANLRNLESGVQSVYVTYKKAYNPAFTEASTDIPQEFLDYMIHIALSDFYMGDGQNERAYAAKGHAERLLTDELYRLEQRKNTNIINTRFLNHHNKQTR